MSNCFFKRRKLHIVLIHEYLVRAEQHHACANNKNKNENPSRIWIAQNLFHIHQKAINPTGPSFPDRVAGVLMPVKREHDNYHDEYRRADGKGSAHVKVVRGHSCAADSSPILEKN